MTGRNNPRIDIAGPGPGQYDMNPVEHGPKYSLTGRNFGVGEGALHRVPGPGTYQVTKISAYTCSARSAPAFTIGGRTKTQLARNNTPGPCDYKTEKSMNKTGFSFGRPTFRTLKQSSDDTPGPGEYQVINKEKYGPQYSIRGHNHAMKTKKHSNMPGPANYYPQLPRQRPAFSIGSGQRFKRDGAQTASTPGPSDYDISRSVIAHRTAPSIVIASKPTTKQYESNTPGPAEYTPVANDYPNKGFSLLGRHRDPGSSLDQRPGPGAYNVVRDPTKDRETPAYSIGGRPKGPGSDLAKKYLPGPGSYQPKTNAKSSPKYTLAARIHTDNDVSGPGPGDYISHSVQNNAPAFSLGAKLKVTHLM